MMYNIQNSSSQFGNGIIQGNANINNLNNQLMPFQNLQYTTYKNPEFQFYYKSRTPSHQSFVSQQSKIQRPQFQKFQSSINDNYHQRQSSANSNSDRNGLIINQPYQMYQNERQRSLDFQRNMLNNNQYVKSKPQVSKNNQFNAHNQIEQEYYPSIAMLKFENMAKNENFHEPKENFQMFSEIEQTQLRNDKISMIDNNQGCCYPSYLERTKWNQENTKLTDILVDSDNKYQQQDYIMTLKQSEFKTDNLLEKVNKVNQIQQEIRNKFKLLKEQKKEGSELSINNSSKQSIDYQYGQSIISSNNKQMHLNVENLNQQRYDNFQFNKIVEEKDYKLPQPDGDRDVLESYIRTYDKNINSNNFMKLNNFDNKYLYEIQEVKHDISKLNQRIPLELNQTDKELRQIEREIQDKLYNKSFKDFDISAVKFNKIKSEKELYQIDKIELDFQRNDEMKFQNLKSDQQKIKPGIEFSQTYESKNIKEEMIHNNKILDQHYNQSEQFKYSLSQEDIKLKEELKQNFLNIQNDIYQKNFSKNLLESIKKNNYFASLTEKEQSILIQLIKYMSNLKIYEEDYPQQIRKQLEILTNIIQANRQNYKNLEKKSNTNESEYLIREIKDQFDFNYIYPQNSYVKFRNLTPPPQANKSELKLKARNKSIGNLQKEIKVANKFQKNQQNPNMITEIQVQTKQKNKALSIYQQILGEVKKTDKRQQKKSSSQVDILKVDTMLQKQEQYHMQRVLQKTHSQIQYENLLNQNAQTKFDEKHSHSRKPSFEKLFEKTKLKQPQKINKIIKQEPKKQDNKKQKPNIQENKLFLELFIKNVKKNFKKTLSQFELQKLYIQMLRKRWGNNYQSNLSQQDLMKIIQSDQKFNDQFYMIECPSQQIEHIKDNNHFEEISGLQENQELFEFV